ncbi:Alpha/Beta hydrolase protein [Hyaloraphidium curvatum]|nr:Alpha/Beta hydrolase protein [Hyaloraphidium curvatum]
MLAVGRPNPAKLQIALRRAFFHGGAPSSSTAMASSSGTTDFWHGLRSALDLSKLWYPEAHRQAGQDSEAKLLARSGALTDVAGTTPSPRTGVAPSPGSRVAAYSSAAATARLELVHIGNATNDYINTLILDRTDCDADGLATTHEVRASEHPPDLLADLNAGDPRKGEIPPSEVVQIHQYGVSGADVPPSFEMDATSSKTMAQTPTKTLVLAHGYGAGLGFFYKNFLALGSVPGWRVMAIDWLGMGNSSRPPFPTKRSSKEVDDRPERAEEFFVESLELWRKAMKLESFTLAGHSLGGYLACAYALKYPERVEKLILISPVGVPEPPNAIATEDGRVLTQGGGSAPGWAARLWESGVTPFTLIRAFGPWGRGLVERYTTGRLGLEGEEGREFASYLWNISVAKGSGEYALASLLLPGAWAKRPLANRLAQLPESMPITAIYGDVDWMDYRHFLAAAKKLSPENDTRAALRCVTLPGGHHLYLDNPSAFNRVMVQEMVEGTYGRSDAAEGIRVWERFAGR